MKTPEEIKKGLKCCIETEFCCPNCPYDTRTFGCHKKLRDDALVYIQRLEAQVPRWISVEERPPEPFVPVLVHMPGEKPHPTVREGYVTRKGKWHACLYDRDPDEVTHWMQLPEPPKEDAHAPQD